MARALLPLTTQTRPFQVKESEPWTRKSIRWTPTGTIRRAAVPFSSTRTSRASSTAVSRSPRRTRNTSRVASPNRPAGPCPKSTRSNNGQRARAARWRPGGSPPGRRSVFAHACGILLPMPVPAMVVGFSLWVATAGGSDLPRAYQDALDALRTSNEPSARALAAIAVAHGFPHVPVFDPADAVDALSDAMQADADPTGPAMAAYALRVLRDLRGGARPIGAIQATAARGVDPQGGFSGAVPLPGPHPYPAPGHAAGRPAPRSVSD